MTILKLKLNADVYRALAEAAEAEHRPVDMQAEYLIFHAVTTSSDGAEATAVVRRPGEALEEVPAERLFHAAASKKKRGSGGDVV